MSSILYVENNSEESQFWETQFADLGYGVHVAQNGVDALGMIRQHRYDLIILNQDLPEYSGVDMLRTLADEAGTAPIIMIAGKSDPQVAHIAYELGISHYIIKDIDRHYVSQLPAAVRQTLEQQRLLKELAAEKEKSQRLNRNLLLLNRVGQLLTSTLTISEVTDRFVTTIADLFESEGNTVWLFRPQEDLLAELAEEQHRYPGATDEQEDRWKSVEDDATSDQHDTAQLYCAAAFTAGQLIEPTKMRVSGDSSVAGWVAANAESVYVADVSQDERFSPLSDSVLNFVTKSLVAVPLRVQNRVIGVLELVNINKGEYDENTQSFIETLAASAAIAIENARLIEQLRAKNKALEEQNDDLDAYTGSVAHDLKNPITHFLSYADELREHYHMMPPEEIENYLDVVLLQSRRMNTIIDELLLLARVRMTQQVPIDELDMEGIVLDVIGRLELDIQETKAQIHLPDVWHDAYGYASWVESIWYNYLTNGLKYGGVPPTLSIGSEENPDGKVRYWIQDTGHGLRADELAKLFQPFPVLNRKGVSGNGLGLVIVKRIAERLNGDVDVESVIGEGSKFYFSLPSIKK